MPTLNVALAVKLGDPWRYTEDGMAYFFYTYAMSSHPNPIIIVLAYMIFYAQFGYYIYNIGLSTMALDLEKYIYQGRYIIKKYGGDMWKKVKTNKVNPL